MTVKGELFYFAHRLDTGFKSLELVPISDVHYGNPLFSKSHFTSTVKYINDTPNAYTILNGDLIESSLRTSKGDIYKQVGSPQDQRDWITDKLYHLRHKILGVDIGNHENRILNEVGIDVCADIAKALNVPYRAAGIMLKISFGDNNRSTSGKPYVYFIYATHGQGGARTKSAKAVKVERLGTWIHADCYFMSHDHVVNVAPDVYLMPDPRTRLSDDGKWQVGKVVAKRKMLVKTNAFLKFGGYSEIGGFPPVDLETVSVRFAGEGSPKVKVTI